MKREFIGDVLGSTDMDREVTVAGWVKTRRDSKGGFSFIELNDGSCFANLQVIADNTLANYAGDVQKLFPGAAVRVTGKLVASQGGGQSVEVQAAEVHVFGHCEPDDYPLQKKRISFERLREIAHLRPRTNTFGAITRLRNALSVATHGFFQARGFYYLHTPIITTSDCEGAGEMFAVTTLDQDNLPKVDGKTDYSKDFFGKKAGLTVSGQLEAETYACALGNVYTFGPTFRAENSNTRRHLAEFWMVEPEMAFADLADDAELARDYLQHLFRYVLDNCGGDMDFFNKRIDTTLLERLESLVDSPYEIISYTDAVDILVKSGETFDYPVEWGTDLQSEHERYLTEQAFKTPVIVRDYPREIKAFYMRLNDDERTVAAMDVLLPQVGEIIGGSQREDRADVLRRRIAESHLEPDDYGWYCDLRRFGSVPHAGFGLGFERMVQFCTGMQNIRDVIPFPRAVKTLDF